MLMDPLHFLQQNFQEKLLLNEPLAPYTTLKVGGTALYCLKMSSKQEAEEAVRKLELEKISSFLLPQGEPVICNNGAIKSVVLFYPTPEIPDDSRFSGLAGYAGPLFEDVVLKPDSCELANDKQGALKNDILRDCMEEHDGFRKSGKIPASYLLAKAGLRGKKMGDILVPEEDANFFVNLGKGTANHAVMLISYVKQQVRDQHGVQLRERIRMVGF